LSPGITDGLLLAQESVDDEGYATFFPVHTATPLPGELRIPTNLIFGPGMIPPNLPQNYTLQFEEIRRWIDVGTNLAGR
jgi:hypothetical protein